MDEFEYIKLAERRLGIGQKASDIESLIFPGSSDYEVAQTFALLSIARSLARLADRGQ